MQIMQHFMLRTTPRTVGYDVDMIGHLQGTVMATRTNFLLLSVGGVGYKVFTTKETLARTKSGAEASLWTHLAVREDILDLYGFFTEEELRFFELLLTVSGIGPKSALGILDIAAVETLRSAIAGGNAGYLTKVSGIGKKTAEKIILELRDKVGLASESAGRSLSSDEGALEALRALGYSHVEGREALRKVSSDITGTNDRLREALKILASR
jgi:Holliday junction DNA helicase RuvA